MNKLINNGCTLLLYLLSSNLLSAVENSENAEEKSIERIIVTSQKRVQSLNEVPLSVAVFSGEKIDKNTIANLEELTSNLTNITINESGISTNLFIRGVGSGVNIGFEQAVGTYIDGVYYGRGRSARSAIFDIERVEVLKGPQDTLFGKNAIAGALNITTRQASDEREGYWQVDFVPKFGAAGIKGAINLPLTEQFSTRLAILSRKEDGWIYNTNTDETERKKEDFLMRSTWLWQVPDFNITFKGEYGKFETKGRATIVSSLPESHTFYTLAKSIDDAFEPHFSLNKSKGGDSEMGRETADNEIKLLSLTMNSQQEHGLYTLITAYNAYQLFELSDVDYLPFDFIHLDTYQNHKQGSFELRYSSEFEGDINYIAGLYYQRSTLESVRKADLDGRIIGLPFSGRRHNTFIQESENKAIFAQVNWQPNEQWQVNTGLRLSQTRKELYKNLYIANLLSETENYDELANQIFRQTLNIFPHQFADVSHLDGLTIDFDPIRKESNLSPSLNIQYFTPMNAMLYASIAKGFKGGGFDEDNTSGKPDQEEYENEEVLAYELGLKTDIGHNVNVNLAIFRSQYNNIQVSTFDGVSGFNVGNAAKSVSQGIEFETRWQVNNAWQVNLSGAYLNAEYQDYPTGQCTVVKLHCSEQGFQNLSDRPLQFSPKWTGIVNVTYSDAINTWLLVANVDINYSDSFEIPGDLDVNLSQSSFSKVNARVQLGDISETWYLALIAKNITNKLTTSWGNDIALAPGGYFQHVDMPRSVELSLHWSF